MESDGQWQINNHRQNNDNKRKREEDIVEIYAEEKKGMVVLPLKVFNKQAIATWRTNNFPQIWKRNVDLNEEDETQ